MIITLAPGESSGNPAAGTPPRAIPRRETEQREARREPAAGRFLLKGCNVDFLTALREQVESRKSRGGRLLLRRLDRMLPARRKRALARLEAHAVTRLQGDGMKSAAVGMDWGSINWDKFFENLIKLLTLILPLFI